MSEIPSPAMLGRSARKNELMAKAQHKITRGKLRPKKHLWLPPEDKSLGLRLCILENKPNELAHPFQTGQGHKRKNLAISQRLFVQGRLRSNVPSSSNEHDVLVVLREGVLVAEFRWAFRSILAAAFPV